MTGQVVTFGVGLAVGGLMILMAVLIAVLPKFRAITWLRYMILPLIMAGTGGILAATVFGVSLSGLVHTGMDKASGVAGHILPALAFLVPVIIAVVAAAIFVHDAIGADVQRRSVIAAVGVPATVGFIPGALGSILIVVLGLPVVVLLFLMRALFGGI